jgi:hypothetical protein
MTDVSVEGYPSTDVSVCQPDGFQAVWRFLRLFRNLQIMTH